MNLFFLEDLEGDILYLNNDESFHVAKVLRLSEGDIIFITDGKGTLVKVKINDVGKKNVVCEVIEKKEMSLQPEQNIHIAIAPVKNIDRFEFFIEKVVEMGVGEITPLICARSERRILRTDRLEKTVLSAVKQSLRTYKPVIHEAVEFRNFINIQKSVYKFIAHCNTSESNNLFMMYPGNKEVIVLIGPEGDFTPDEIKSAIKAGYKETSLGQYRLRTETAGIVACHTLAVKNLNMS